MTWATPLVGIIAAAIAVPTLVILYFLKLRRKNVEVSTTLLWKKAIQDLQANAPFQRLRRNILLLLQLLALGAALFALAQPQRVTEKGLARKHVILIDRSASMNALDGADEDDARRGPGFTRLDAAKEAATKEVEALREPGLLDSEAGDEAMVIAFDTTAEVLQTFTADKARLKAVIESIRPTDVPGSIEEAFRLAQAHRPRRQLLDDKGGTAETAEAIEIEGQVGGPPQTFHLFSDGRIADMQVFLPGQDDSLVFHRVGSEGAANVAITGLRAERGFEEPSKLTVFVGLQNTAATAWPVDVELIFDDRPVALREVVVPAAETVNVSSAGGAASAGSSASDEADAAADPTRPDAEARLAPRAKPGVGGVVFNLETAESGVARVRLITTKATAPARDVLPTDDEGLLIVPAAKRTSVAVVTAGNLYLEDALAGLPLADLRTMPPAAFAAMPESDRAAFDVVILDGWLPEPPKVAPGVEQPALPNGRWLVLNAVPPPPQGLVDEGEGGISRFIDWRRNHPVLAGLTLDGIRIAESRRIRIPETSPAVRLADTTVGPGIVELASAGYRAIVVPWNIGASNWPFDVSFVVFLASSVQRLGATAAAEQGAAPLRTGEVLSDRLPGGASAVEMLPPEGAAVELVPSTDGRVAFGPLRRSGVYRVRWSGQATAEETREDVRPTRRYAANLLDAYESDAAPGSGVELASGVIRASDGGRGTAIERYWPRLILAALAVLMLEWYVFNRKVHL